MFVILKIPIAALAWLIWWSTRPVGDQDEDLAEDDSGRGGSNHPRPRLPRPPRAEARTPSRRRRRPRAYVRERGSCPPAIEVAFPPWTP